MLCTTMVEAFFFRVTVTSPRVSTTSFTRCAPSSFSWPAPGPITSPFGDHRNHPGIDIDGETGDPVLAAGAGTVTMAGQAPGGFGGYGILVAIDHGDGLMTLYAHLSQVAVTIMLIWFI